MSPGARLAPAAALVAVLSAAPAAALNRNAGVNSGEFLSFEAGARAHGMGNAFTAVAEGPEAVFWNPAGLSSTERPAFSYTRAEMLRTLHHDYYAAAIPARWLRGWLGFSASLLTQDALPVVTNADVTLTSFRPHSEAFTLAYSYAFHQGGELSPGDGLDGPSTWRLSGGVQPRSAHDDAWKEVFAVGVAAKTLQEVYYTVRGHAVAVDAGALWRPASAGGLSLSLVTRNFGKQLKFLHDPRNLPWELDLGAAYDARAGERDRFLPSLDVVLPYYNQVGARLGFEYARQLGESRQSRLSWRLGYDTLPAYENDALAGFAVGLGFRAAGLSADFGFQPLAALGDVYKMGLGYRW